MARPRIRSCALRHAGPQLVVNATSGNASIGVLEAAGGDNLAGKILLDIAKQLSNSGKVRAIGVSYYMVRHLDELLAVAEHVPAVNQIELSPYNWGSRRARPVRRQRDRGRGLQPSDQGPQAR